MLASTITSACADGSRHANDHALHVALIPSFVPDTARSVFICVLNLFDAGYAFVRLIWLWKTTWEQGHCTQRGVDAYVVFSVVAAECAACCVQLCGRDRVFGVAVLRSS
eukprot:6196340-Pleurochrysis_carterae.AAC.1